MSGLDRPAGNDTGSRFGSRSRGRPRADYSSNVLCPWCMWRRSDHLLQLGRSALSPWPSAAMSEPACVPGFSLEPVLLLFPAQLRHTRLQLRQGRRPVPPIAGRLGVLRPFFSPPGCPLDVPSAADPLNRSSPRQLRHHRLGQATVSCPAGLSVTMSAARHLGRRHVLSGRPPLHLDRCSRMPPSCGVRAVQPTGRMRQESGVGLDPPYLLLVWPARRSCSGGRVGPRCHLRGGRGEGRLRARRPDGRGGDGQEGDPGQASEPWCTRHLLTPVGYGGGGRSFCRGGSSPDNIIGRRVRRRGRAGVPVKTSRMLCSLPTRVEEQQAGRTPCRFSDFRTAGRFAPAGFPRPSRALRFGQTPPPSGGFCPGRFSHPKAASPRGCPFCLPPLARSRDPAAAGRNGPQHLHRGPPLLLPAAAATCSGTPGGGVAARPRSISCEKVKDSHPLTKPERVRRHWSPRMLTEYHGTGSPGTRSGGVLPYRSSTSRAHRRWCSGRAPVSRAVAVRCCRGRHRTRRAPDRGRWHSRPLDHPTS